MDIRAPRRFAVLGLAALLLGLGSGCGDGDGSGAGAGDVVVQVMVAGGFVPVEVGIATVPTVTVLGDGMVITPAPVDLRYPGPAITPLQSRRIDGDEIDALLARARVLGLLDGALDFGSPPVVDAPTTTVTITSNGRTYRHEANALGFGEDAIGSGGSNGLSAEQLANRRALSAFVTAMDAFPPGDTVWVPDAIAVYDIGAFDTEPVPQPSREWPLDVSPAVRGSGATACALVEGNDVDVLRAALDDANARTPWIVDGVSRALVFRPILPGQPACD